MNYRQLIKHFGSQQRAADAIGVTQATVSRWNCKRGIPPYKQLIIERITNGELASDPDVLPPQPIRNCITV